MRTGQDLKEEREKRARQVAERLFKAMEFWDGFDIALHRVEEIVHAMAEYGDPLPEDLMQYYDLTELYTSAVHYYKVLGRIVEQLEKILFGGE